MSKRFEPSLTRPDGQANEQNTGSGIAQPVQNGFQQFKVNRAVRVSFSGGLLGALFGSSRGKVERVLTKENSEGWNLAEVIPDNPNLAIWIVRILLLAITLGLWTLSTGYIFIFERPR